jgi:hypothetical protein
MFQGSLNFLFPAAWLQHSAVGRERQICTTKDATVVPEMRLADHVKGRKCAQGQNSNRVCLYVLGNCQFWRARLTSELPLFIHFW